MKYADGTVLFLEHRQKWVGYWYGRIVTTQTSEAKARAWLQNNAGRVQPSATTKVAKTPRTVKTAKPITRKTVVVGSVTVSNALRDNIRKRVAQIVAEANAKWPSLNMTVPNVEFYSRGRIAGKAVYAPHLVKFNEVLAAENVHSFDDTVIHEVGHLVTNKIYNRGMIHRVKAHGPEFKHVCRVLGGSGKTYHSYDVSSVSTTRRTVVAKCACSTHMVTPQKAARMLTMTYTCRKCKGKVAP
jgi:predicted SprT family Zn-dependent metalloprotease